MRIFLHPKSREGHKEAGPCRKNPYRESTPGTAGKPIFELSDPAIGTYRFRIGDYRMIFDMEGNDIVVLRVTRSQTKFENKQVSNHADKPTSQLAASEMLMPLRNSS